MLSTPARLAAAKKAGVDDPQKAPACLKCHAPGAGANAAKTFDPAAVLPVLSKAFASDDLTAANRLTTRLKYLRKYLEETRARRISLEQPEGSA